MRRALINAVLGDGFFWRHPESVNWNLVWNSIHKPWLQWKQEFLVPTDLPSRLAVQREAGSAGCFANSKTLYQLKTHVHDQITVAKGMSAGEALNQADLLDLAIWFLDDGCAVRRQDSKGSYRIYLSVGPLTADDLFPHMERILGLSTKSLGRVFRNNSKASERNKSWVIPKAAAVQIMGQARQIAPECLQYKTPIW